MKSDDILKPEISAPIMREMAEKSEARAESVYDENPEENGPKAQVWSDISDYLYSVSDLLDGLKEGKIPTTDPENESESDVKTPPTPTSNGGNPFGNR